MEKKEETPIKEHGVTTHNIPKTIEGFRQTWSENLTEIDISKQNIHFFEETTKLPPHLAILNLTRNNLEAVPEVVLCHRNIKHLNLSHNKIVFFDDIPGFCQVIEHLNLANNKLHGPPYWIWSEKPSKLVFLNLSNNHDISQSLDPNYLEDLLQCNSLVTHLVIHDCRLGKFEKIFGTFPKAKHLVIGGEEFSCFTANLVDNAPGPGLSKCCDIERLNLQKTKTFSVNANIAIFKYIVEINLSDNQIRGLPDEFCSLEKLEICYLSSNYIMYLPENIGNLQELQHLYVDHNELCLLSDDLTALPKLKTLDVYNNALYEVPESFWDIAEIDVAQNFLVEPEVAQCIEKKTQLRRNINATQRIDGHKVESERPESEHSASTTDDETFMEQKASGNGLNQEKLALSSSEDWDSDRYWVPHALRPPKQPSQASWLCFIKQRMNEGRFCPMDLHTVPVFERVMYEKQCNPTLVYESEGQFDDLTEDDS